MSSLKVFSSIGIVSYDIQLPLHFSPLCFLSHPQLCLWVWFLFHNGSNDYCLVSKVSLVAQVVKSLPAVQKTWVRSLGQEDPLEKLGKSHGQRSLAGYSPWGCKEADTTK